MVGWLGLSCLLAAIARDAGVSPDALSDFLEGTHGLPSESLDRLASAAGIIVTMVQSDEPGVDGVSGSP
jgi:hypothetical protein